MNFLCYSICMCLFPLPNESINSRAYKAGVTQFKCGACPECMQERSSLWALRAVYEAKEHVHNCMITLTYDTFKYDESGKIIGENPVNPDLKVQKPHIQKFLKRLRKKFSGQEIKYIACAEYGSRTHRAHYHLILFNVCFSDAVFYKKSKRGNPIYRSKTLTDLWSYGICTIDCINIQSAVARYCTKYCAKTRSDETFMLFSQGVGLSRLMQDFNGLYYMVEGRKHPVPRVVWQQRISEKYKGSPVLFDYRYKNFRGDWKSYIRSAELRHRYFDIRDADPEYQKYIEYWKFHSSLYEKLRDTVLNRIYALDERKYGHYKSACLCVYADRLKGIPVASPGSGQRAAFARWYYNTLRKLGLLPFSPRLKRATDTKRVDFKDLNELKAFMNSYKALQIRLYDEKYRQLSFF